MDKHPLTKMIQLYCDEYESLREEHLDLSHLHFHRSYGLSLTVPPGWPTLESIDEVLENNPDSNVVIIFSTTDAYRELYSKFNDKIEYFSWHEIFTGMQVASTDIRYLQRSKNLLSQADFTFFIDPPCLPNIIDQVRGHAEKCLIIIGNE